MTIRSYWNRVEITTGLEKVAEHPRSYGKDEYILRPEHYLDLLERRPHAIPYARPLIQHEWPNGYWEFYRKMVASIGPSQAGRDFIRILRCHGQYGGDLVSEVLSRVSESNNANADVVIAAIDRERHRPIPAEPIDLSEHPRLRDRRVVMCPDPAAYSALKGGDNQNVQSVDH